MNTKKKAQTKDKSLLNAKDCFFMAMGGTIGAGIISNTGIAIGITGTGVVLAYILAFLVYYIGHFPLIIMTSIKPVYSCHYVYTQWVSKKMAGMYMYVFLIGRVSQAYMGIAFGTYLATITNIPVAVGAVGMLTLLYGVNMLGIENSAKLQNIITTFLILSFASFIILGLPKVNLSTFFLKENMFPQGAKGIFNTMAILLFGVGGSFLLLPFGPKIENPAKTIPKMVTIGQICACVLFCLVAFVGAGVGDLAEIGGKPLTYQARIIYPGSAFLIFIIGGALLAIATTINANYINYYTSMEKGCEEGWLPRWFAKRNKFGVPGRLLTLFWLIAIVPIILGLQIGQLVSIASALTLAQTLIPLWGLVKLPKLFPKEWQASRFHMPTPVLWLLTGFCTTLLLIFIILNFMTFSTPVIVTFVVLLILSAVLAFGFGDKITSNTKTRQE